MTVGERIKALMEEKGYSQNRLAKAAKISQSGLSTIINGASSPSVDTVKVIADVLDCPAWKLIEDMAENLPEEYRAEMQQPRTQEARSISGAIDRMPKEERVKAESVMRTLYEKYFEDGKEKTS